MSTSGVVVNPECQQTFMQLAEGKKSYRYIIYKIENNEVVVDKAVTHEQMLHKGNDYDDNSKAAFEEFVGHLKQLTDGFTDCRYAVFDFKFKSDRGAVGTATMDKIIFIQLCPDSASVKRKMVYASSASAIKTALGSSKLLQIQVSDEAEISHRELFAKLSEKFNRND